MSTLSSMPLSQQSLASAAPWALPVGQALRLSVGPGERWLQVRRGPLWLTRSQALGASEASQDVVLRAGEGLALPAGSEWVIEGWGGDAAVFELLVPPRACAVQPGVLSRCGAWLRAAWARRRPAPAQGPQLSCA
jgi:hypothetical protein